MLIIGEVDAMDRRWFLTSVAGVAAAGALAARDQDGAAGRPPLAIEPDGEAQWRIRSWEWRGAAWRPTIARATQGAAGIEIRGRIDAADRAEVLARLERGSTEA